MSNFVVFQTTQEEEDDEEDEKEMNEKQKQAALYAQGLMLEKDSQQTFPLYLEYEPPLKLLSVGAIRLGPAPLFSHVSLVCWPLCSFFFFFSCFFLFVAS